MVDIGGWGPGGKSEWRQKSDSHQNADERLKEIKTEKRHSLEQLGTEGWGEEKEGK